jgi:hypothetical protein
MDYNLLNTFADILENNTAENLVTDINNIIPKLHAVKNKIQIEIDESEKKYEEFAEFLCGVWIIPPHDECTDLIIPDEFDPFNWAEITYKRNGKTYRDNLKFDKFRIPTCFLQQ